MKGKKVGKTESREKRDGRPKVGKTVRRKELSQITDISTLKNIIHYPQIVSVTQGKAWARPSRWLSGARRDRVGLDFFGSFCIKAKRKVTKERASKIILD